MCTNCRAKSVGTIIVVLRTKEKGIDTQRLCFECSEKLLKIIGTISPDVLIDAIRLSKHIEIKTKQYDVQIKV